MQATFKLVTLSSRLRCEGQHKCCQNGPHGVSSYLWFWHIMGWKWIYNFHTNHHEQQFNYHMLRRVFIKNALPKIAMRKTPKPAQVAYTIPIGIAWRATLANEAAIEVVDLQPIDLGYERIEYNKMTAAKSVSDRSGWWWVLGQGITAGTVIAQSKNCHDVRFKGVLWYV